VAPEVKEVVAEVATEVISWETLDALYSDSFEYVPEPGGFLWPCTGNEECTSGFCVPTPTGGKCTTECVEDCHKDWVCVQAPTQPDINYICQPRFLRLCDPCVTNDECKVGDKDSTFLDLCLQMGETGSFCGAECKDNTNCPKGYTCQEVTTPGGTFLQCVPAEGAACACSQLAVQEQKKTECVLANEFGECTGERVCTVEGLTDCSASAPEEERCDDKDNDCDGSTDEGCDDDKDGYCDAAMQTLGKPASCGSGGGDCDDGDATVFPGGTELCDKKDNNCDGKKDEGLCEDGDACTDDLCDPIEGCSHPFNDGACDDNDSCTENDHCFEGQCSGSAKDCDDGNPCTDNLCNKLSEQGCYWPNNSAPCDDDGNPCTVDVCENGACQHKLATDIPCDDGNPCTDGDVCKSGQCVAGPPKACEDDEQCTKDSCKPDQGCVHEVLSGTPCQYDVMDLGLCIMPGKCGSNGCVPDTGNCQCPNCLLCVCCGPLIQVCLVSQFPGGN